MSVTSANTIRSTSTIQPAVINRTPPITVTPPAPFGRPLHAPVVSRDTRAADAFNQLLKLDSLAGKLCGRAAQRLSARAWRLRVQEFEVDHRRHTKYLAHLVYTVGGSPDWRYDGALASDVLAESGTDQEILADLESNKTIILRRYDLICSYLERLAPPAGLPEMREILRRNLQDHRLHLNWLAKTLRQPANLEATADDTQPQSAASGA